MNASERKRIDKLIAMVQAGDRAGTLAALRAMKSRPSRPLVCGSQLVLTFVASETFRCERLNATFRIDDCLNRRGAVWPSGGSAGKRGGRKGQPKEKQCQGCPVGEAFAFCLPGITLRAPTQAPEVLPWSQRMAKRARALVDPGHDDSCGMNPLSEAAMLSRDDVNDWRA